MDVARGLERAGTAHGTRTLGAKAKGTRQCDDGMFPPLSG